MGALPTKQVARKKLMCLAVCYKDYVMSKLADFPFGTMREACRVIAYELSDRELETYVRVRMIACLESDPTPAQLYDMMVWVAARPCDRVRVVNEPGKKHLVAIGDISGFVQAACDVSRYYRRPEEVSAIIPPATDKRE